MKRYNGIIAEVYLVLIQEDEVLLLRRYHTGYEDGNYSLVAGHLEEEETCKEAMIREAEEEAGIEIDYRDLEVVHVMHRKIEKKRRIAFFLRPSKWRNEPENREPDKCDDLSWYHLSQLPENIIPYIKEALINISEGNHYSEY
jgi:8-oxo-dGTP diphosphatase